jgi:hypothetical protein
MMVEVESESRREHGAEHQQSDCDPTVSKQNSNSKRYEHKIVGEDELLQYLDNGWEIVKELSGGRVVIRMGRSWLNY